MSFGPTVPENAIGTVGTLGAEPQTSRCWVGHFYEKPLTPYVQTVDVTNIREADV